MKNTIVQKFIISLRHSAKVQCVKSSRESTIITLSFTFYALDL